jgi:beta-galactosidase
MSKLTAYVSSVALAVALLAQSVTHADPPAGRERVRLDSGWRFHLGDLNGAESVAVTQWSWRVEPLTTQAEAERDLSELPGDAPWNGAAPGQDTFHGRLGFAWYKTLLPPLSGPGVTLHFESVDDNATVYLNGVRLLHHEGWDEPFDVPLDAPWRQNGPNIVTVLVENTDGAGGIGNATLLKNPQGAQNGPAAVDFDDRDWRPVHLPHDFVVEGTFDRTANVSHGYLPAGVGWYRKTFTLPASYKGGSLWLDFDGVYRDSDVWLNGKHLGNHKSGYTGFRYDITHVANCGGANTLAVRADARAFEGWWYEGGGIYRHVWLNRAGTVHIAPDGVFVVPAVQPDGSAQLAVSVTMGGWLMGEGPRRARYELDVAIQDDRGRTAAHATRIGTQADEEGAHYTLKLALPHARLWSPEDPYRYRAVVRLHEASSDQTATGKEGQVLDSVTVPFGVRTVTFDPEKGLLLNGRPVKIKGTCNHQDFAGVGTAMPDSLLEWRIKKLKEMGANAYRCSHNPPASELLDACDRLGMLVMDENRHLGDTYRDHSPRGTPYSDLSDLRAMILRDRNHPSIIMWSMCNEEGLQGSEEGATIFRAMKKVVNDLDPTRPVTCAMNGNCVRGISLVQDLQGCNYNPRGYDQFHQLYPERPVYGSETASAVSTRGEYANDREKGYVSAYDENHPPWGQTAEEAWRPLAERPFMAGGFVWTGFDYRGEPTPYAWPCINSHFGIMDICGFPKDSYYYYQSWWGDKDVVHLLPHWNWPGKEGQPIDVWCHSNADKVELFLNGKSLGAQEMPRNGHLEWKVNYAPGRLEAKGYRGGRLVATDVVETTGPPTQIRLTPDRKALTADGEDVILVAVSLLDEKGRVVPFADNEVRFAVTGSGQVAGVGNGDPSSHEPDRASQRKAFHGLCLVVVRAGEQPGPVELTATASGLKPARLALQAK